MAEGHKMSIRHHSCSDIMRVAFGFLLLTIFSCVISSCRDGKPTQPPPEEPPDGPIAASPTWSPDGSKIAYYRAWHPLEGISSRIQIVDVATGEISTIDSTLTHVGHLDWSADERWIIVESNGQIVKLQANGDSLTVVTQGPRHFYPNWSPDGLLIVFLIPYGEQPTGLHTVRPDGSKITSLGLYGLDADWAATSDSLIAIFSYSSPDSICYRLGIFSPKDSLVTPISNCRDGTMESCAVSPDGKYVAFKDRDEWYTTAVYLLCRHNSRVSKVSDSWCSKPAWAPDATTIVYSSLLDGALHTYNIQTHKTVRITPVLRPLIR